MLDKAAIKLKVLKDAVEVIVQLLRGACLGGVAGVVEVLVRVVVAVRVVVVMLVLARVVADLLVGVACARERGRVGNGRRPARGCKAAVAGTVLTRCRRRIDRGAVVEAVLS